METAAQEILAVTHWFEPAPRLEPYPVTIRFVGRRTDVEGPLRPGDQFVWDETIAEVVPGSGPISVTARIHGVNPGEWAVTAQARDVSTPMRGRRTRRAGAPLTGPTGDDARYPILPSMWRRWTPHTALSLGAAEPVHTCPLPFARAPGALPLIWVTLVMLGMAVAFAMQSLLIGRIHLDAGRALFATAVAIVVGIAGAKGWFVLKRRDERRFEGWCIQGFIVGASIAGFLLFMALGLRTGVVLDATAPGLLFGMAIGRVGCFFAGCCGGPPTASRWGVWSSDQRVGARRVPTQLLESALALSLGLVALVVIVRHQPASGAHFVAALAAYTLGRQGVLRLRAEPNKTWWAVPATALASGLVLIVATAIITLA